MKVIVNGEVLTLFEGAKVADALRMHSPKTWSNVQHNKAVVLDKYGNHVSPDGALNNNTRLFVRMVQCGEPK